MSATAAEPLATIKVEIDPAIRQDPKLAPMVDDATAFFDHQYQDLPEDPHWSKPFLVWKKTPLLADSLRVEFGEEHTQSGSYLRHIDFPTRYLFDSFSRRSSMRDLMFKVTKQRSSIIRKEISRLIGELEAEEEGG